MITLAPGTPGYPPALAGPGSTFGGELTVRGSPALLRLPLVALFASVRLPGEAVLCGLDLARALRDAGLPVVGGFQSPLERECLDLLCRGPQPVVLCPARAIHSMRIARPWRPALQAGRMLVLSPFPAGVLRPTAATSELRNRLVAALAERIVVIHATPGGRVHRLAADALRAGRRVLCADLRANHDLLVLGAEPVDARTLQR